MMIPSVFTLLLLYQFTGIVNCAYVNISLSATNVRVNGSLQITLVDMNPACCENVKDIYLYFVHSDGSGQYLAAFDSRRKQFDPVPILPLSYQGRLYTSGYNVTISPVAFGDEKKKYYMLYEYYVGLSVVPVESRRLELQTVYDLPVFASSLQSVYTAIEGIPKPITCSVKSRPASNITWSHDAEVVGVATQNVIRDGYYFITTGTFTIEKPLYSMRGKNIFCTGKPKFGAPIKQNTTLNVLYRPRNTVFTVTPPKLAFNTNIQLSCTADGIPSTRNYRFYVNGNLIGNKTDGKLTANVSPIDCVTYAGEYKCVPESTVGDGEMKTATREFDSSVTLNASKVVNEAQEVTLSCSAKGCPTSEITWKKNGISLVGKTGSKLHLLSVTKNDSGEYSCHATFWNKTKSAKMTLTVNHKPDNVQFTTHTLEPKNGEEVVLRCSSDGLPAPSYSIYKIDGSSSSLIASSSSHSIASINYVDYTGYKATFRCESKNILGNATKDLQLDIQVEPVFSLTVTPNIIMENQSTRIECKVTAANPPATTTLRGPNNSIVSLVNGTTRLTNVKRESNGIFSCTAANSGRPTPETKTANLIVQYQPDTVTFGSSSLTPVTGSRMTLTCTSNGVPAPSYKIESISGTSTKIIRDTTSGTYSIASINYANYVNYRVTFRCTPRNTIGSASKKEVKVNIQVAPVLVISKEKTIEEGREASFSCNVTAANPATTVRWKNPSDEQIQHSNGFIKVKTKGTYTCLAKNSVAESKQTVELVVTGIKPPVAGKSSSAGIIGGVIGGLLVLVIIAALIYFFVIKGSPLICGSKTRLVHGEQIWKNEDQYVPMEGIAGENKNKNVQANAPEESPRVNGSDSKEPIVPAQGDEYPHKYTVRYQLPDGTQYATVATRGKADIPGVTGANVTVIDEDTDADNSKKESQYAEIAAFNLRGNIRSPSDIPERTEYATLEECGPIAKHPPTSENENVAQIMGTPTEI